MLHLHNRPKLIAWALLHVDFLCLSFVNKGGKST